MVWPHPRGKVVRLVRMGCVNRPFYQIGPIARRKLPINSLPEEVIGNFDPIPNEKNEIIVSIDLKRLAYWLGRGASLSPGVQSVLGLAGFMPIPPEVYIKAWKEREKISQNLPKDTEEIETVLSKKRILE